MEQRRLNFNLQFVQEHLEEAAFLYEQRIQLLENPQTAWPDLQGPEASLETHLDALHLHQNLSLQPCMDQAQSGGMGELYTAICILCRCGQLPRIPSVLSAVDTSDPQQLRAIADGLTHEVPTADEPQVIQLLSQQSGTAPIAVEFIGRRRCQAGLPLLYRACQDPSLPGIHRALWALGRFRDPGSHVIFRQHLPSQLPQVAYEAGLGLLRIGQCQEVFQEALLDRDARWPLLFGLSGDAQAAAYLMQHAGSPAPSRETLLALGLLGEMAVFPFLCEFLCQPGLGDAAALALQLLTGAGLYEEAFVPDEIDEDELFDEELERLRNGESLYPEGQEPGRWVQRLSQQAAVWQHWYQQHQRRFFAGVRYRNGTPCVPASLVAQLENPKSPRGIRELADEELVIRYGLEAAFDATAPVAHQRAAIAAYSQCIGPNHDGHQAGTMK